MKPADATLTYDLYIAAPAERVWGALTDPAVTEQYFYGTRVESSFLAGAPIAYAAGDVRMVDGEVVAVEAGRKLVLSQRSLWDPGVAADAASQVSWELTPLGVATKLSLVHAGFAGETETFRQSAAGWPVVLSGLKTFLETGRPLTLPAQG